MSVDIRRAAPYVSVIGAVLIGLATFALVLPMLPADRDRLTSAADALDGGTSVLIVGTSHVYQAIRPHDLPMESVVLGVMDVDIDRLTEAAVTWGARLPRLSTIIMELTPEVLLTDSSASAAGNASARQAAALAKRCGVGCPTWLRRLHDAWYAELLIGERIEQLILGRHEDQARYEHLLPVRGYQPEYRIMTEGSIEDVSRNLMKPALSTSPARVAPKERWQRAHDRLTQINARPVTVLTMIPPRHPIYRSLWEKEAARRQLPELPAADFDFSTLFDANPELFANPSHTNDDGARKLTEALTEALCKRSHECVRK